MMRNVGRGGCHAPYFAVNERNIGKAVTNRKEINDKIVKWIVNKVNAEYADDISLVFLYGSYINGSANGKSDVDCYYIPKTERGYNMAVDFIIDGVGYDIFPMSWERVAKIADLHESLTPLVGDVRAVYYHDAGDLRRFKDLQDRLRSNLQREEYVRKIAAERCDAASGMCAQMNLLCEEKEIRKTAGNIIMTLADAVAVYHHDYYHFGLKKQFENLRDNFPGIPESIVNGYKNVVEAANTEDVKKHAEKMLEAVCEYLDITSAVKEISPEESRKENKLNVQWLAGLYEEISSMFQKIYVCCENGNDILAFLSAVCLQRDLDDAEEAGCPGYDLLSGFNHTQLHQLSAKAREIERDFVRLITENGGNIKKYDSFEAFERAKL